ncbi:MAG: respiratory nitrate reductase subunit gamma, partial [Betaproteobacteria bacterium]
TPHSFYGHFMEVPVKQMLAIVSGGAFGLLCFIGLTMLIYRRIFDPRIRYTSHRTDIAILVILWVQLVIGLITLPFSWAHSDGSSMLILADWAQRILTLRHVDVELLVGLPWPFLFHIVLGMTIFLLFPFSRLVHVWSGFASIAYLIRPYQVVRSRRLNVPAGHNLPRRAAGD